MSEEVPSDTTTTETVREDWSYYGWLSSANDVDWISVSLEQGKTYAFLLRGHDSLGPGNLRDPLIEGIYDSNGNALNISDDNGSIGLDSLLFFTPTSSGTYFVAVASSPDNFEEDSLTYQLLFTRYGDTPFSPAATEFYSYSDDDNVNALLDFRKYINLSDDGPTDLTFSFPSAGASFSQGNRDGYGNFDYPDKLKSLSDFEKNLFVQALEHVASFANLSFREVPDTQARAGVIRVAWTYRLSENFQGEAFFPAFSARAGDIWFSDSALNTGGIGSKFHHILLHELGHALGLKHPFESSGSGVVMPSQFDGLEYTVMSYNDSVDKNIVTDLSFYPTTFMYYDILALQHLYGAIDSNHSDTTYSFEAGTRYYETVWDTGGTDTYDASSQIRAVHLDLTPGSWSNVGTTVFMYSRAKSFEKVYTVFTPPEITIERALGGLGDDTLTGNDADNLLTGNLGDDSITGGAGDDTLRGNAGEDTLKGGLGNDALWAGAGDASADRMSGGLGNDTLGGGAGNDLLDGGNGADVVFGGSGDDTIAGGGWVNGAAVTDETSAAQLWAGDGNDFVFGADGNDQLGGGDDDDNISGFGGDDVIYAGKTGADTLDGGDGDDVIFGGSENDVVTGGSGNDEIYGGGGNDIVTGGTGVDTLYGGTGDDTLTGGGGDDILRGGDGADVFVFSGSGGDDQIDGFTTGEDVLDLGDTTTDFTNLASVQAAATDTADGLLIDLGGGDSVLLTGLALSDLSDINILYS